jgi:hypothetical protein
MTTSVTETREAESPNIQIQFRDDIIQPELRVLAERTVAALVARSAKDRDERFDQRFDTIPGDREPFVVVESRVVVHHEAGSLNIDLAKLGDAREAKEIRVINLRPPFPFSWSWNEWDPPYANQVQKDSGRVLLDARTGALADAIPTAIRTHSGFGCYLSTEQEVQVTCYASCRLRWEYWLQIGAAGNEGFAEGNMEFTAIEDGNLLAYMPTSFPTPSERIFDGYAAAYDAEHTAVRSDRGGPQDVSFPRQLRFAMRPGRGYTFNVGLVVYSRVRRKLYGGSRAFLDADVNYMSIVR